MTGGRAGTATLLPYLPRVAREWATAPEDDRVRTVDGSLVFVDISGFTALSERLASRGKIGAEELTDVLSSCFAELLAVAYADGGSLLKFGGDALLLLFDGDGHAHRACHAAIGMRRTLRTAGRLSTTVGNVRLRMSVGIHSGDLHLYRAGSSHQELLVTGPGASTTVDMESTAEAGEILVSPAIAAAIDARLLGDSKGAGVLLRDVRNGGTSGTHDQTGATTGDEDGSDALLHTIPLALREHLLAGGVESEHRHATVAFVHFDDVDALTVVSGPEAVAAALHELVTVVQAAADDEGVTFLGTDIDRDGGKVILVAGAPTALGDDEGRMLRALRRVADAPLALPVRIGVNRGHVFVGEVGPHYRRTFTAMGDAVNLAARLMAKAAPGQILATADVLERSRTGFETVELEPFGVKGKSRPVHAFAVGAATGARATRQSEGLPFTGRDAELRALLDALDEVRAGSGRMVEVTADAGLGKTRLATELLEARGDGVESLRAACEPYESTTPYYMASQVVRRVLGVEKRGSAGGRQLRRAVSRAAPDLLPWLPLLADASAVEVPMTPEVADLEPRFRRQRTTHVVADLIGRIVTVPAVLVIEDAQWMDDASADLLAGIAAGVADRPWLLLVTRRDERTGFRAPDAPTVTRLTLAPLADDAAAALVTAATADDPLRPDQRAELVRRADGNPLYIEELLRARAAAGDGAELPESLEALLAADIDRLPPLDRRVLRHAAVLGVTFEPALLAQVLGERVGGPAALSRRLQGLVVAEGRGRLRFRNRVVHDVAYNTLPYRRRRELHRRAGEAIELAVGESALDRAEVLSLHFLHAQDYDRCWRYARVAADRARDKFANVEAKDLYERALAAARQLPALGDDDVAAAWVSLGDVSDFAGDLATAKRAYRHARQRRVGDAHGAAKVIAKEAVVAQRQGRASSAIRWTNRALGLLDGATGDAERGLRAELLGMQAFLRQTQGRYRDAIRLCEQAVAEGEASGNRKALVRAYQVLDWAHMQTGRPDLAVYGRVALEICEQLGDLRNQGILLNSLGAVAYYRGEWDEALDLYRRGREANARVGNIVDAGFGDQNIAEILIDQGRLDEAEEALRDVASLFSAVGFRAGVAYARRHQGRIAGRRGDYDEALRLLAEARAVFVEHELATKVLEVDIWTAECHLRGGNLAAAVTILDRTIAAAEDGGATGPLLPALHRLRAYASAATGAVEDAWAALDESLHLARECGGVYDVALTLEAISVIARLGARPVGDPSQADDERERILAALGVRSTPPPPLPATLAPTSATA